MIVDFKNQIIIPNPELEWAIFRQFIVCAESIPAVLFFLTQPDKEVRASEDGRRNDVSNRVISLAESDKTLIDKRLDVLTTDRVEDFLLVLVCSSIFGNSHDIEQQLEIIDLRSPVLSGFVCLQKNSIVFHMKILLLSI